LVRTATLKNPWDLAGAPFASGVPTVKKFEAGAGGLQDGNASGGPCVRFVAVHWLNAGTSGTRIGVAPCGRGWLAPAMEVITMSPIAPTARANGNTIRRLAVAIEPLPLCGAAYRSAYPLFLAEIGDQAATITCVKVVKVDTPHGQARAHLHVADRPSAALVLGHGAGGGVTSPDLVAVTEVARSEGVTVALVEQPYRVAGRRAPAPARQLDVAWTAVVDHLLRGELRGLPLVVGGRSLGARVACRTAGSTGAVGVLCLAFPLQPPRRSGAAAAQSRLSELDEVAVPTLVVQGAGDPFGIPPETARRTVVQVPGNHSLRTDLEAVSAAVRAWLPRVVGRYASAN
jgi:uncharacterized protein